MVFIEILLYVYYKSRGIEGLSKKYLFLIYHGKLVVQCFFTFYMFSMRPGHRESGLQMRGAEPQPGVLLQGLAGRGVHADGERGRGRGSGGPAIHVGRLQLEAPREAQVNSTGGRFSLF